MLQKENASKGDTYIYIYKDIYIYKGVLRLSPALALPVQNDVLVSCTHQTGALPGFAPMSVSNCSGC
jgi:hypothetical protein